MKEFGIRPEGVEFRDRTGAYAVVQDSMDRFAIVETELGGYLPGGGLEAGESLLAALQREVQEECGCGIRVVRELGRAVEYLLTRDAGYVAKQGTFFLAEFEGEPGSPESSELGLRWLGKEEALQGLTQESHRWAIAMASEGPSPAPCQKGLRLGKACPNPARLPGPSSLRVRYLTKCAQPPSTGKKRFGGSMIEE